MPTENQTLAIAGINPSDRRCCFVAERDAENVAEALSLGLIVVPVTAETARKIFGQAVDDLCAIAA
jgi:hypothetical protein